MSIAPPSHPDMLRHPHGGHRRRLGILALALIFPPPHAQIEPGNASCPLGHRPASHGRRLARHSGRSDAAPFKPLTSLCVPKPPPRFPSSNSALRPPESRTMTSSPPPAMHHRQPCSRELLSDSLLRELPLASLYLSLPLTPLLPPRSAAVTRTSSHRSWPTSPDSLGLPPSTPLAPMSSP